MASIINASTTSTSATASASTATAPPPRESRSARVQTASPRARQSDRCPYGPPRSPVGGASLAPPRGDSGRLHPHHHPPHASPPPQARREPAAQAVGAEDQLPRAKLLRRHLQVLKEHHRGSVQIHVGVPARHVDGRVAAVRLERAELRSAARLRVDRPSGRPRRRDDHRGV